MRHSQLLARKKLLIDLPTKQNGGSQDHNVGLIADVLMGCDTHNYTHEPLTQCCCLVLGHLNHWSRILVKSVEFARVQEASP